MIEQNLLTTLSQNPDFSNGVNISTGSTSSYSSISWGTDREQMCQTRKRWSYKNQDRRVGKQIIIVMPGSDCLVKYASTINTFQ